MLHASLTPTNKARNSASSISPQREKFLLKIPSREPTHYSNRCRIALNNGVKVEPQQLGIEVAHGGRIWG